MGLRRLKGIKFNNFRLLDTILLKSALNGLLTFAHLNSVIIVNTEMTEVELSLLFGKHYDFLLKFEEYFLYHSFLLLYSVALIRFYYIFILNFFQTKRPKHCCLVCFRALDSISF